MTVLTAEENRTVLEFVLHEGRNRQIRRMCAAAGLEVLRLRRIAEGPLQLGTLAPGAWRPLTEAELAALRQETEGRDPV